MSWVKIDDRFPENPKIAALSDTAFVAYVTSICYCARELTDGFVPMKKAKEYAGKSRVIQELVSGLWEPCSGGFRIHHYLQYNPTRSQVLAEREAAKRRMSGLRAGRSSPEQEGEQEAEGSPTGSNAPVNPVSPSNNPVAPEDPLPLPKPERLRLPSRQVAKGFEDCFGRLLSPMELEEVRYIEDEHPSERIEYALRQAAGLNKRTVRYVQRTCERIANGDDSAPAGGRGTATSTHSNGVANSVSGLDQRVSSIAERRRNRTPGG